MIETPPEAEPRFRDLNLPERLLTALAEAGYETPSPIQSQAIPPLLEGNDILGHAPTGTGKTAAFALPLLARIDPTADHVQVLTLTPTRELAIQVAEAFKRYAAHMPGFHVLPIYGGQPYAGQIRQLKRGVQVVVGTPGRVMDHMRKGTLKLGALGALVLDEADEMLRMGFVEEVEWILAQTPERRQMALFSATMPKQIEQIAERHLKDPRKIAVEAKTATADSIRQRHWIVSGLHKLDALTRILEVESFDAVLIFVRTKTATLALADRLEARGHAAAAMNGDMPQRQREQMISDLKKGALDILVATDVAARGLDVDRISHVVNYDIPYDTEAYIHRIGRTGRFGRQGEAIIFVAPRERRLLRAIERATRQPIEPLVLPTTETVNNKRVADFKQQISDTLAAGELASTQEIVEQYAHEHGIPAIEIAAALAKMAIGDRGLMVKEGKAARRQDHESRSKPVPNDETPRAPRRREKSPAPALQKYRVDVGRDHGAESNHIIDAIADAAGIDAEHIGPVTLDAEFSVIELPPGMPREILKDLKKAWVCGRRLKISRIGPRVPDRTIERAKPKANKSGKKRPLARSKSSKGEFEKRRPRKKKIKKRA